jgi:hypothetical protein
MSLFTIIQTILLTEERICVGFVMAEAPERSFWRVPNSSDRASNEKNGLRLSNSPIDLSKAAEIVCLPLISSYFWLVVQYGRDFA